MAVEKELKLALSEADIATAIRFLDDASGTVGNTFRLGNVYYDSPALDLAGARVALRLRRTPNGWLQTFKTAGKAVNGMHARGEWELPVSGDVLELPALLNACDDPEAAASLRALADQLAPVFRTDFDRTTWDIVVDDGGDQHARAEVEVALDLGAVHLGTSDWQGNSAGQALGQQANASTQLPLHSIICELELELKAGSEDALLAFASQLRAAIPGLRADDQSKAARGYALSHQASTRSGTATLS